MDKKLHLLESYRMRGDDGNDYVVHAYEHLARLARQANDEWEPTGQAEYKLADGEHVDVDQAGALTISRTGVRLH